MEVCLLTINYNGEKYLKSYLSDIAKGCNVGNIDLIVTDDQSTDGSIDFLKENNYTYTVNQNMKHGFAANVNNGIKYALKLKLYDYLIIANNDIKVAPNLFMESLPMALELLSQPELKAGMIGFDEVLKDREEYFVNFDYDKYSPEPLVPVKDIPGFFFIVSTSLIEKIGFMDEEYFMYGEDNDYFARTIKAGYKIYNTNLPVMHFSEGSSTNEKRTSWYVYRNSFLYAQKNEGFKGFVWMFLAFIWKIYNPFYRSDVPSNLRVTRNGFFYNNYLLTKSLIWNIRYYFERKTRKNGK